MFDTRAIRFALVCCIAAGCGGSGSGNQQASGGAAQQPAASAPAAAPTTRELDLCTVMPLADVSRIVSATVGVSLTSSQSHVGGGCSYRYPDTGAPTARVLIEFTDHGDPAGATAALTALRAAFSDRGMAMTHLPGLGDEAFAAADGGAEAVKVRRGGYMGQVNVRGDELPPAGLREAAKLLAAETLRRLP